MIDLHMHILPGMDDGARDLNHSIRMAKMAAESRVSVIAATPHSMPGRYENEWDARYRRAFLAVKREIEAQRIPVKLVPGMEICVTEGTVERLRAGTLITLGGTRTPLVEFGFDVEERTAFRFLEELLREGYVPMLAHPERYRCVMDHPRIVYDWYRMGVIIQINKGSVLGRFGRRVKAAADLILAHRLAAVAASDAHSPSVRTPDLTELEYALDMEYGPGCFDLLMEINPRRVLEGKPVIWEDPVAF